MKVQVSTPGLFQLRRDLKAIKAEGLGKDLSKGLRKAVKPLTPAIRAQASATLPARGGYGPLMSKSVRARSAVKEDRLSALISVTIYAAGRKERRDIRRVNAGDLRHPNWGRTRRLRNGGLYRNPWSTTRVPPGFVTRPIDDVGPRVTVAARKVVDDLIKQLKG